MNDTFDEFAEAYEAMIDWPRRLAHEEGFYRWLFERVGAKRVLDAACGTGHHAAMFGSWGLGVEGADVSEAMVRGCEARWGPVARWVVRGYDMPAETAFDLAICIGNSLALAVDRPMMERAVRAMLGAVRPGGAVVIHVLNLWRLTDGEVTWQKCQRASLAGHDSLILKGVHRAGDRGFVDMLVTQLDGDRPVLRSQCAGFWGVEAAELEKTARAAGAAWVEVYGAWGRQDYAREKSQDLIVVAGK